MGGPEQGLPTEVLVFVVIIAAVALYFKMIDLRHDIEYRIRDLHREVGAVKREIEYRANAHDRDLERLLSDRRTSR